MLVPLESSKPMINLYFINHPNPHDMPDGANCFDDSKRFDGSNTFEPSKHRFDSPNDSNTFDDSDQINTEPFRKE